MHACICIQTSKALWIHYSHRCQDNICSFRTTTFFSVPKISAMHPIQIVILKYMRNVYKTEWNGRPKYRTNVRRIMLKKNPPFQLKSTLESWLPIVICIDSSEFACMHNGIPVGIYRACVCVCAQYAYSTNKTCDSQIYMDLRLLSINKLKNAYFKNLNQPIDNVTKCRISSCLVFTPFGR